MPSYTKNTHKTSPTWILVLAFLSILACRLGSAPMEVVPTDPPPTATQMAIVPPPTPEVDNSPDVPTPEAMPTVDTTLNEEDSVVTIEDLQAATVQILAKTRSGNRLQTVWTGSGTIISADGLILTNAHVAAPNSTGLASLYQDAEFLFTDPPDALVVAINESADRAPVETYFAELLTADGHLDLAVIQIVKDIDGNPVDATTLNLPYLEMGDSNSVRLGDEIRVLGFPGVGGDTVTFTRGDVSGFESQARVGDRAWIKTDTTISPGNSGGLGANMAGELIGVPSFTFEASGGAINRLRSINYAQPLIEAARNGLPYDSPFVVRGTGNEQFRFLTWADDFDVDQCAVNSLTQYGRGTVAVIAIFSYKGLADGEEVLEVWYLNDELVSSFVYEWELGERGDCAAFYTHNFGEELAAGTYLVELYVGADLEFIASESVQVGQGSGATGTMPDAVEDGVTLQGTVVDADTGRGIENAGIFLLNPGVNLDDWFDNPNENDVYSFAETDSNGDYILPDLLERGVSYPAIAAAEGYVPADGFLDIETDDPDIIIVDLELSK